MDCRFNPLCGSACMIDARLSAGGLDLNGHISAQELTPWKLAGELVELGQVACMKCANAGENAAGTADLKIGPPNLGPATAHQHTAYD